MKTFKIDYKYMDTIYHINVTQKDSKELTMVTVDGVEQKDNRIILTNDEAKHDIEIIL